MCACVCVCVYNVCVICVTCVCKCVRVSCTPVAVVALMMGQVPPETADIIYFFVTLGDVSCLQLFVLHVFVVLRAFQCQLQRVRYSMGTVPVLDAPRKWNLYVRKSRGYMVCPSQVAFSCAAFCPY